MDTLLKLASGQTEIGVIAEALRSESVGIKRQRESLAILKESGARVVCFIVGSERTNSRFSLWIGYFAIGDERSLSIRHE